MVSRSVLGSSQSWFVLSRFDSGRFGLRLGRIGSVRLDAVRSVFGLPRFGPSIIGAFRVGSESPPLGSSRYGTESDLELELVERPARLDCNQLELCVQAATA